MLSTRARPPCYDSVAGHNEEDQILTGEGYVIAVDRIVVVPPSV